LHERIKPREKGEVGMSGLTEKARKTLKTTVDAIRDRLIKDLYVAADRKFSFSVTNREHLAMTPENRFEYQQLTAWCDDEIRSSHDFDTNVRHLIKETAYTLTNRLFILRQMEARGLQGLAVLSGGKDSSGYKEFRDFCPELCQGDDEGFGFLLQQLFDKVAQELPGFFSETGLMQVLEVPGPTLFWLIDQLNQKELESAWTDDTTIGWLYQYWNDPDRTAVNNKVAGKGVKKGKVEANEIAHATQLFTERYMVEWLLQNSLGTQWLAICQRNGWGPGALHIIDTLEQRREDWREKLKNKEVPEDVAMPIEAHEDHWKFYVKQAIPDEVIAAAPSSLKEVRILDPACGSGHFLVYAFDLLFDFYCEEAELRGSVPNTEEIVQNILAHNLHGIDIDPRAVQLAASALYLKAKEKAPLFLTPKLNLVATDLGLANLKTDDPSIRSFVDQLARDGIMPDQSLELIDALKGADYLGSLLQMDKAVEALKVNETLFSGSIETTFKEALNRFILTHDKGEDLGVRTRAEQLAKGLRLIELLDQKYHVVCANPPYLGSKKLAKKLGNSLSFNHLDAKYDLFSIFMSRITQLLKEHGFCSMITMHSWMFLSNFEKFRLRVLKNCSFSVVAHMGRGGGFFEWTDFDKVMQTTMFVLNNSKPTMASKPIFYRLNKFRNLVKSYILLCQSNQFSFLQSKFKDIEGSPMIYWWPEEFRQVYLKSPKVKDVGETRAGCQTSDNTRFLCKWWEVSIPGITIIPNKSTDRLFDQCKWVPYMKGGKGKRWFETLTDITKWSNNGKEMKAFASHLYKSATRTVKSQDKYFKRGVAYTCIGTNEFSSRMSKYSCIFDVVASSIFPKDGLYDEVLISTNSVLSFYELSSINPTIHYQVGDVERLSLSFSSSLAPPEQLFNNFFESEERSIEYIYKELNILQFELEEIKFRCKIDINLFSQFNQKTIDAIKEEVGELESNFKKINLDELEKTIDCQIFEDVFLNGPLSYELGEIKRKKDGQPVRGKLQHLEELCHEFQLHPETIIDLTQYLGLKRKGDRQDEAYRNLAWALGVALGRFDAQTGGLVDLAEERRKGQPIDSTAPGGLPHGMFFLSERGQAESHEQSDRRKDTGLIEYLKSILSYKHGPEKASDIWEEIQQALVYDCKENLTAKDRQKLNINQFLREKCFDFHKSVYENRPIYFPLASNKKAYVVWCNIHQWKDSTLQTVLAEFLMPEKRALTLKLDEMRTKRITTTDKKELNALEKAIGQYKKWDDELEAFIQLVSQIAEKGINPEAQERDMPYVMDLDDGVMINSAALWPLLHPLSIALS
jgi:hypothetical protein